jgi:hypothetical protein
MISANSSTFRLRSPTVRAKNDVVAGAAVDGEVDQRSETVAGGENVIAAVHVEHKILGGADIERKRRRAGPIEAHPGAVGRDRKGFGPDRREPRRDSELMAVEPQVNDLLVILLQNRDRVVRRDDVIASVWGAASPLASTRFARLWRQWPAAKAGPHRPAQWRPFMAPGEPDGNRICCEFNGHR